MVVVAVCAGGGQVKAGALLRPPRGAGAPLLVPGLRLVLLMRGGGKVSRAAAVGQVVSVPDTSPHVSRLRAGSCRGTHQLPGLQLTVNAHDGALTHAQGRFSLPLELPPSSQADAVSAPFAGPVPVNWCEPG